tara:strand:- start:29797 stop:32106 length:2310 start_codon:yes stop_codon:yes gene_type:complete
MPGPITIPIILQNVGRAAGAVGGAGAGAVGSMASPGSRMNTAMFGQGGPGEITKGLGQIAKQLPGAGMMEGMTQAFKQGGPIGMITAGVAGMLGFVKQIMESSKVFQGIAGSFFKIFGAMADVFLLPFLPLAMRGMQMLMQHIPTISDWGTKAAGWLEGVVSLVSREGIGGAIKYGWETHIGPWLEGMWSRIYEKLADAFGWSGSNSTAENIAAVPATAIDQQVFGGRNVTRNTVGAVLSPWSTTDQADFADHQGRRQGLRGSLGTFPGPNPNQLGGIIPGGPGAAVSATLHGGELVVPSDVVGQMRGAQAGVGMFLGSITQALSDEAKEIETFAVQHQQKQMGAGGELARFNSEVIRGHLPNTWDDISSIYQQIEDETSNEAQAAAMAAANIVNPLEGFDPGFDKIANEIERTLSTLSLGDFVLDDSIADEIQNCFTIANQCINTKWTSLADLVEQGAKKIQLGEGGDIIDVEAINKLVETGRYLGGQAGDMAESIASQFEYAIQSLADPAIPDVSAREIQNMIDEANALQTQLNATFKKPAEAFNAATHAVHGWTEEWWNTQSGSDDDTPWGWMYGSIGQYYGDAAQASAGLKGFTRKKEIVCGSAQNPWQSVDPNGTCYVPPVKAQPVEDDFDDYDPPTPAAAAIPAEVIAAIQADPFAGEEAQDMVNEANYASVESNMDVFNAYVAATSTDMDTSRSMDYLWDTGSEYFSGNSYGRGGRGGGGGRGMSSNRSMTVNIHTRATVQDILSDLARVDHMDETSFFNGV